MQPLLNCFPPSRFAGILNQEGSSWLQLVQLQVHRTSDDHSHQTISRNRCVKMVQGIMKMGKKVESPILFETYFMSNTLEEI